MKRTTVVAAAALGTIAVLSGPVTPSQAACPTADTTYYCVPSAPAATTGAAAPITNTAAVLNGTALANGQATQVFFQYGTTPALGQTTAPQALTPDYNTRPVTALIGSLTPGTTYFFRIVALNSSGPAVGTIGTFKTTGTAPTTPPVGTPKKPLPRVSLSVRPSRDRSLPYQYTTSGRITLPSGVSRTAGCKGRMVIRFLRGNRVVARNATRVSSTCRYSKRTSIRSRALLRRGGGTLSVSVRFQGNDALRAKSAPRKSVRYGR